MWESVKEGLGNFSKFNKQHICKYGHALLKKKSSEITNYKHLLWLILISRNISNFQFSLLRKDLNLGQTKDWMISMCCVFHIPSQVCPPPFTLLCAPIRTASRRPCLWLPVGFSQWVTPAGDMKVEDNEFQLCIPRAPSLWGCYIGYNVLPKATATSEGPHKIAPFVELAPCPSGLGWLSW